MFHSNWNGYTKLLVRIRQFVCLYIHPKKKINSLAISSEVLKFGLWITFNLSWSLMSLQVPFNLEKIIVWYVPQAKGTNSPYFHKNYALANATVNLSRCKSMINDHFFKNWNCIDPDVFWFHQDDAIPHVATVTFDTFKQIFGDTIISRMVQSIGL